MTIWDEMQAEMREVANIMHTSESILVALALGVSLAPITCATGPQATRLTFLKLAALAAIGVELVDAEMEADNA